MRASKLLVLLGIILLASLALAGSACAAERCVLAELMTSTA